METAVALIHEIAQKIAWRFKIGYHTAEDIAQEACISVWLARSRGLTEQNLCRSFLFTVLVNKIMDYKRCSHSKVRFEGMDALATVRTQMTVEDEIILRDTKQGIGEILDKMTLVYRNTMRMRLEDMKYQEIADNLGIPLGTVKSRIDYARRRFAALSKNRFTE